MFWQTEWRRLRKAVLTVGSVYAGCFVLVWVALWVMNGGGHIYRDECYDYYLSRHDPAAEPGCYQTILNWMAPWMRNGAYLALAILAIWVTIIVLAYRRKKLCTRCEAVMTKYVDDDQTTPICSDCYFEKQAEERKADAKRRASYEPTYSCSKCHCDMAKHYAYVNGDTTILVIDVCTGCGSKFLDENEQELLEGDAEKRGYNRGYSAGSSSGNSSGVATGLIIGMAIN